MNFDFNLAIFICLDHLHIQRKYQSVVQKCMQIVFRTEFRLSKNCKIFPSERALFHVTLQNRRHWNVPLIIRAKWFHGNHTKCDRLTFITANRIISSFEKSDIFSPVSFTKHARFSMVSLLLILHVHT